MATATTDPLVGRLVDGRYEVLSRIARGGMATVYLAMDRRLDRRVALKVMHAHLAEGPGGAQFVARFRREARAAARLTHPAIVAVYDQGTDDDMSYLAMEYVPGTTLRHELHEAGPLSLRRTLDVLESVCEALAAAHRADLVHRDVKPENVLIDTDGRVRITDFGLARAVDEVTATTTGTVMGTVAYLAPELIAAGRCDTRGDVYAVGIMAYEMVTGTTPHAGASPIQVAFQHVNTDVPAPSELAPGLPTQIDELVRSLTARESADRPTDASAALDLVRRTRAALAPGDLDQVPARPVRGSSPSETVRLGAVPAAHPVAPVTGPGAGDPGATELIDFRPGTTPSTPPGPARGPSSPAPTEEPPDAPRPRRTARRGWPWAIAAAALVLAVGGGLWWWTAAGPGAYTTVPTGIVGAERASAEATLDRLDLAHTSQERYDDTVPAGRVVSADPESGSRIRKDGTVDLVVSRGIEMLTVPTGLVGMTSGQATTALEEARLQVTEPTTEYSDTVPADQVMAVSTAEGPLQDGQELAHNVPVTLTVSGGPEPVVIADVRGMDEAGATATLQDQGLHVTVTREDSEEVAEGQVIRQDPVGGADGHRLDAATIVVSAGPPMVDVPNLYGRNVEDARGVLEAAGFVVKVEYPQLLHPFNMVYSQTPEGGDGKQARKGSTITLDVF